MNTLIAYCGLNCEQCDARKATIENNDCLRAETARKWCEMNHTDQITPESINCMGCRTEGTKFYFCSHMCEVRKCAESKGLETCGQCESKTSCEKLAPFRDNPEVAKNLQL